MFGAGQTIGDGGNIFPDISAEPTGVDRPAAVYLEAQKTAAQESTPFGFFEEYVNKDGVTVKMYRGFFSQDIYVKSDSNVNFLGVFDHATGQHSSPNIIEAGTPYYAKFQVWPVATCDVPEYVSPPGYPSELFIVRANNPYDLATIYSVSKNGQTKYVYIPIWEQGASLFTESGMLELAHNGEHFTPADPVNRAIYGEMAANSNHEKVTFDLMDRELLAMEESAKGVKVIRVLSEGDIFDVTDPMKQLKVYDLTEPVPNKAGFQKGAGMFRYVTSSGETRYVYLPPTPESSVTVVDPAYTSISSQVPGAVKGFTSIPLGKVPVGECAMATGAGLLFILPPLLVDYAVTKDGEVTPMQQAAVTGTHVASGATGVGLQYYLTYNAAVNAGAVPTAAATSAGVSTAAITGGVLYSGVATYTALDVIVEDVYGIENPADKKLAAGIGTAALVGTGFTVGAVVGFGLGGPVGAALGGVVGALVLTTGFAGGSLGGMLVNKYGGEAINGQPMDETIAEAAAESEEVQWVHEKIEENPWLGYAAASWALTGNPLPGLAIYGIKEGIEWLNEPVDMEVDNTYAPEGEDFEITYAGTPYAHNLA